MSTIGYVLSGVMIILATMLSILVLSQSKRSAGLGSMEGSSGSEQDTYWSKNKGNSIEGTLERYTKIGVATYIILALLINFLG